MGKPKKPPRAKVTHSKPITIYYWWRGFLLLSPSFELSPDRPYHRRLSATLMFGLEREFSVEVEDVGVVSARALLLAPNAARRQINSTDGDFVICDVSIATPEFEALAALLDGALVKLLDPIHLEELKPAFARAQAEEMTPQEVRNLVHRTILLYSGRRPTAPRLHPRMEKALQLIQEQPLRLVTPTWLAGQVHLSTSRLRELFNLQLGTNLTQFLRWSAVQHLLWIWTKGRPLAELISTAGFYDLAHLNHAFNEVFGLNPSELVRPEHVRITRCVWDDGDVPIPDLKA